jgi:hypothetical protein
MLILAIMIIIIILVIGYVVHGLHRCSQGHGGLLCKGWHMADKAVDDLI